MSKYLLLYLSVIAIISVIVTAYDKYCAKHNKWRIPESTLFALGAFGGALPMLLCMKIIRHKTKKKKFMVTLPVFSVLQAILIIWLLFKF